jgi:membrane peptidoglycan carboxypeptidase
VKNILLESAVGAGDKAAVKAATARKNSRKVKEIKMAIELEKTMPKDAILEKYLNIALFGQNNYGVEAAAQYYFQTTAAKLTLAQAAMLAGIVQAPESYNPFKHPKAAKARRETVLSRMVTLGKITTAERDAANAAPMPTKPKVAKAGCISAGAYAYFCDYAKRMLLTDPRYAVLGKNETERLNSLQRGGYKIVTTMDAPLMREATIALMKKIPPRDASGVIAASVTVEPGSGQVLSIAQNTIYNPDKGPGQTEVSYGVDKVYGGSSGFQVGSTMKPFTLTEWLNRGKGLGATVNGDIRNWNGNDFEACGKRLGGQSYTFDNSEGGGSASIDVLRASYNSVNRAYIDMASRLDLCDIVKRAQALGVHLAAPDDGACQADGQPSSKLPTQCPSLVLGAFEISPMTMANAYAGFAADGTYCPPTPVITIADRTGKAQAVGKTTCVSEAIPSAVARGVTYALKRVLTNGTARGQGLGRWPAAGKTGTTDDSVRTWFVGYTAQRSTAVVVADPRIYANGAYDRSRPGPHSLNNRTIGGRRYGHVFGATIAAPLWNQIMKLAMRDLEPKDWPGPNSKMLEGTGIKVADVVGRTLGEATSILEGQGFKVRVGKPVPSQVGPDRVGKTSPPPGGRLERGSTVVIYPGDASQFPVPGDGGGGFPGFPGSPGDNNGNGNGNGNGRGRNG